MPTYEHGQATDGAPVTWRETVGYDGPIALIGGAFGDGVEIEVSWSHRETICRAFHLAKLAESVASAANRRCMTSLGDAMDSRTKAVRDDNI